MINPGDMPKNENRPMVRSQCKNGFRPCPWVGCRYHLLWMLPRIRYQSDDKIIEILSGMKETCTLDVADHGGTSLLRVGEILGSTRGWAWQILKMATSRIKRKGHARVLAEFNSGQREVQMSSKIQLPWGCV